MAYKVLIKRKIERGLAKLPEGVRQLFYLLVTNLQDEGPVQPTWRNFSALGDGRFHCHLTYRHVACWTHRKGEIIIEVYYVGNREKAPY